MKRLFILFLALLLCLPVSCIKEENLYQEPNVDLANLASTEILNVEVPSGKIAVVKFYEDTLGVCSYSQELLVPKESKSLTRASFEEGITIEYLDKYGHNELEDKSQIFQVIAFEDSKKGDYDYNDLIVHAKITKHGNNGSITVQVHPIALGATKDFGLGLTIQTSDGTTIDNLLFSNCRQELFSNLQGFINTVDDNNIIKFEQTYKKNIKQNSDNKKNSITAIDWYLFVGSEKLYAVSDNYKCLDNKFRPYGLIFTNIRKDLFKYGYDNCGYDWWQYPKENVSIDEIYPFTQMFLEGSYSDFYAFGNPQSDKYFKSIKADENRIVQKESCLYAVKF